MKKKLWEIHYIDRLVLLVSKPELEYEDWSVFRKIDELLDDEIWREKISTTDLKEVTKRGFQARS